MYEELKKEVEEVKQELKELKIHAVKCMEKVAVLEKVIRDLYGQNVRQNEQNRKTISRKRKHTG
jgi:hypothetical protein